MWELLIALNQILSKIIWFVDVCSNNGNNICKNGGTCYVNEGNIIGCTCPKEFDGLSCEIGKK